MERMHEEEPVIAEKSDLYPDASGSRSGTLPRSCFMREEG
jgi:hypothetical protein